MQGALEQQYTHTERDIVIQQVRTCAHDQQEHVTLSNTIKISMNVTSTNHAVLMLGKVSVFLVASRQLYTITSGVVWAAC